jgi:hypothetical protein
MSVALRTGCIEQYAGFAATELDDATVVDDVEVELSATVVSGAVVVSDAESLPPHAARPSEKVRARAAENLEKVMPAL